MTPCTSDQALNSILGSHESGITGFGSSGGTSSEAPTDSCAGYWARNQRQRQRFGVNTFGPRSRTFSMSMVLA